MLFSRKNKKPRRQAPRVGWGKEGRVRNGETYAAGASTERPGSGQGSGFHSSWPNPCPGKEGEVMNRLSREPGLDFVSTSPGVLLISSCPKPQLQMFQRLTVNAPWGPQLYLIRTIIRNLKFIEHTDIPVFNSLQSPIRWELVVIPIYK